MMFLRGDLIALMAVCSVVDFPLPVGPVRSTIPHGPLDRAHEHVELLGLEPEVLERVVLDDGLLLEEAQDDLLAVVRRQGRHAEVDLAVADVRGEAAVLGEPALGDVEPRDDLEPRHDGEVKRAGNLEQVEEEAVDPVPHARPILVGLHVDVRGAVGGGPAQHVVHDLDDGGIGGLRPELLDVHQVVDGGHRAHREPEILAQGLVDALRRDHAAVRLVDGLLDGPSGADLEVHLEPGGAVQIVERHHVQGIGGGDDELSPMALRGDDAVLARDLLGHELYDVEVDALELLVGDRLLAELGAQILQQDLLVEELHLDEDMAQAIAGAALAGEGLVELCLAQDAVVDEHLAEGHPAPALARRLTQGSLPDIGDQDSQNPRGTPSCLWRRAAPRSVRGDQAGTARSGRGPGEGENGQGSEDPVGPQSRRRLKAPDGAGEIRPRRSTRLSTGEVAEITEP